MGMPQPTASPPTWVALRTGWPVRLVTLAAGVVAVGAVNVVMGDLAGFVGATIGFSAVVLTLSALRHVVLTEQGLEIAGLGRTVLPWAEISSVEVTGRRWNGRFLRIGLGAQRRARKLPAPWSAFGVGERDVEAARALIELWLLSRHAAPAPMPVPDPSIDPWATPPEPQS
jgi:hypothetical protein